MLTPHRKGRFVRTQQRLSVESLPAADDSEADESPHIVLPSSTELFYFYRQSLEQCAKYSTGQTLYDLCTLHRKWLKIYAGAYYQPLFLALLNCQYRGYFILKFKAVRRRSIHLLVANMLFQATKCTAQIYRFPIRPSGVETLVHHHQYRGLLSNNGC
jgi:hypothetical protein